VNRLFIRTLVVLVSLGLAMSSIAGDLTGVELDASGQDHFGKAFYGAVPRKEHGKAGAEYRLAEEAFQKAIRSKPDWVDPYLHLARTYFVQGKYGQAADVYRQALTLAPGQKDIALQLASALEKGGDYAGAIAVLQALRTQETDARALSILDDFIARMQARLPAAPKAQKGGR
jgi:cytochrome c-type biogenesis protein CcmH/NrfG